MSKGKYNQLDPHDLGALVKIICKRPQLFVGAERFDLVVAFIEGYAQALRFLFPERYNIKYGPGFNLKRVRQFRAACCASFASLDRDTSKLASRRFISLCVQEISRLSELPLEHRISESLS